MKSVTDMAAGVESRAGFESSGKPPVRRSARAFAVSGLGLASLLFGLAACNSDHTAGFVYAPSASLTSGLINAYGVGFEEGNLHLLADSPLPSGGRNPTTIAVSPDYRSVYVTNHDDSTVVVFTVGTDGKLFPQNTYNLIAGSYPTALAVSADGKFLYIAYTYQNGYTTASPGPGGISIFPIVDHAHLGTQTAIDNVPVGRAPVAIATSTTPGFLYVVSQDSAAVVTGANQTSNLFAFSTDATTGVPTLLAGQTVNSGNVPSLGFPSGQNPASVLAGPSGNLYVTDTTGNNLLTYALSGGIPTLIASATVPTGNGPRGMAIDPTGSFLFVANYEGTIGEYTLSAGLPTLSTTAASSAAGSGTTCIAIEPSKGVYIYASGSLSNNITGYQLVPADGTLRPIINSPYTATTLPLCAVAIPQVQ